jgi:hypothetical protein
LLFRRIIRYSGEAQNDQDVPDYRWRDRIPEARQNLPTTTTAGVPIHEPRQAMAVLVFPFNPAMSLAGTFR